WINPPVVAACVAGVLAWVRRAAPGGPAGPAARRGSAGPAAAPAIPRRRAGRELDGPGLILATVSLAALVYAVIGAGAGGAPLVVAAAGAVAVLAGAGFVVAERRAPAPLLPFPVLRSGT